jgi:hypothetical protein
MGDGGFWLISQRPWSRRGRMASCRYEKNKLFRISVSLSIRPDYIGKQTSHLFSQSACAMLKSPFANSLV